LLSVGYLYLDKMAIIEPIEEIEEKLRKIADERARLIRDLARVIVTTYFPERQFKVAEIHARLARLRVEQQILLLRLRAAYLRKRRI